jgi:hypothetical protein
MAAYLTYNNQSEEMAQLYEGLSFEQVHRKRSVVSPSLVNACLLPLV